MWPIRQRKVQKGASRDPGAPGQFARNSERCVRFPFVCISFVLPLATLPSSVNGHNVLLTGGQVTIDSAQVEIRLQVTAEDFLHWYNLRPNEEGHIHGSDLTGAAARHASLFEDVLVLRDAGGNRLEIKCRMVEPTWSSKTTFFARDIRSFNANYDCEGALTHSTPLLLLQLEPAAFPTDVNWQVVLSVTGTPQMEETVVRLTSRGNAEVVELSPLAPADSPSCESRGRARFQEVCADVQSDGEVIDMVLSIPLPLLGTWFSIPVDSDGFVHSRHCDRLMKDARELIQNGIQFCNGERLDSPIVAMDLVFVDAAMPPPAKWSIWTTRLRARLRCNLDGAQHVVMTWGLFNAAVLSAHTILCTDRPCREHQVTTYDPTILLPK